MADEPRDDEETLDLTEELDPIDDGSDAHEPAEEDQDDEQNPEANDDDDDEETVVSFDDGEEDEDEPESDNRAIRQLRERNKQLNKELAEARKAATAAKPKIEVGDKPTLAGCEYDEETFERELDSWKQRKAEAEREQQTAAERDRAVQEAWQQDLSAYEEKKARLALADFGDAEETVKATLNLVQQAVIVKAAADPAAFIYALSKSEARMGEISRIDDPVKLAAAVARMEGAIKVVKKRKTPEPDRPQRGSGAMPGGADKQLERLTNEAERTGDRTKLIEYKAKLKARGK